MSLPTALYNRLAADAGHVLDVAAGAVAQTAGRADAPDDRVVLVRRDREPSAALTGEPGPTRERWDVIVHATSSAVVEAVADVLAGWHGGGWSDPAAGAEVLYVALEGQTDDFRFHDPGADTPRPAADLTLDVLWRPLTA